MKKIFKSLTVLAGAVLAVAGGLFLYEKFFKKDEELDEDFDDEELFEDEDDEELDAFDSEDEIFEEEEKIPAKKEKEEPEEDI